MIDLSTLDARFALATKYASKYGLDPVLVAAVCEQESSWNMWSTRFENGFLHAYIKPANPEQPTTRELHLATSFGLMQIMGQTAVEKGFTGKYLTELCDPDVGVDFGCKKLQACIKKVNGDVQAALLCYNGGGDPSYPGMVMARMPNYQKST